MEWDISLKQRKTEQFLQELTAKRNAFWRVSMLFAFFVEKSLCGGVVLVIIIFTVNSNAIVI